MRKKLVAGNWKMHGDLQRNGALLAALKDGLQDIRCHVAVFSPAPYLAQLQALLTDTAVAWGAQNLSQFSQGAYTGEVSAGMLKDFGCGLVLVGHSERRALFGETDAVVAAKTEAALAAGLTPVVCVGESLAERESGRTAAVVLEQLDAVLAQVGAAGMKRSVVAYEPVWAIGTGLTATPAQAQEVHAALRARLAECDATLAADVKILYGGSVKAANAGELFGQPDVDGALVGGASLDAQEFLSICRQAV